MTFIHEPNPNLKEYDVRVTELAGKRHYSFDDKGPFPSVTTVLGQKPNPALQQWRHMLGDKKADKEAKRCADRGTAVHTMTELYLNNHDNPTYGHAAEHVRGFNQLKFQLNKISKVVCQEVALFSEELGIAGRVDCIGYFNNKLSIIDFKTSNKNKTADMIENYYKQATAYALMWYEMTGQLIEDITILMSVEKGMVPLVFHEKTNKYIVPLLEDINNYYEKMGS